MTDPAHILELVNRRLREYEENGRLCETSTVPLLRDHVRPALEEMVLLYDVVWNMVRASQTLPDEYLFRFIAEEHREVLRLLGKESGE